MILHLIGGLVVGIWIYMFYPRKDSAPYYFDESNEENSCPGPHKWVKVTLQSAENGESKESRVCSECGFIQGTNKRIVSND